MPGNHDDIITGSGAGGGTLARTLAPAEKRILILERGDWLKCEAGRQGCNAMANAIRVGEHLKERLK